MFTKHTRQETDLLLQVLGGHPKPHWVLGREGPGRKCQLPPGPASLWTKMSSYEWDNCDCCTGEHQWVVGVGKHMERGHSLDRVICLLRQEGLLSGRLLCYLHYFHP